VVEAVRFAGRHGLVVTPQATLHGAISALVGQLLVSTAGLDECVVHPEGWARVGAGVKWLRVVEAAAPHGLARRLPPGDEGGATGTQSADGDDHVQTLDLRAGLLYKPLWAFAAARSVAGVGSGSAATALRRSSWAGRCAVEINACGLSMLLHDLKWPGTLIN
jgi:hypothetical protein